MTIRHILICIWLVTPACTPPAKAQTPFAQPDTNAAVSTIPLADTDTTAVRTDSTRISSAVRETAVGGGEPVAGDIPWIAYISLGILLIGGGVVAWWFLLASDDAKEGAKEEPRHVRGHPVFLDGAHFMLGNAQDIGRRKEQQDAFGFSDTESDQVKAQGLLAVVADGMGGMAQGSEASRNAVQTFLNAYASQPPEEDIQTGLYKALIKAQASVRQMAESSGLPDGIGTTLIATVTHQEMLYWISVGDSHIYLMRDKRLTQLNVDHNYGLDLLKERAAGLINQEDIEADPDRQALISFLGISDLNLIDRNVRPFPLQMDDRILLCSDGLYGVLSEAEIMNALREDPQDACEALVAQTIGKGFEQQDNVTAVVLVCEHVDRMEQTI